MLAYVRLPVRRAWQFGEGKQLELDRPLTGGARQQVAELPLRAPERGIGHVVDEADPQRVAAPASIER